MNKELEAESLKISKELKDFSLELEVENVDELLNLKEENEFLKVDKTDTKFDVIETYNVNDKGIIDNATQKKVKAFEIIKEKRVDVSLITDTETLQEYNEKIPQYISCAKNGVDRLLTQEEYDLLKEILLCK